MSVFARLKKAREEKKGFTLVELIVVLVILAILAAILVPALLGWIDEAKKKQYQLEARNIYVASQAIADEMYAKASDVISNDDLKTALNITNADRLEKLADLTDIEFKTITQADNYATDVKASYTIVGMKLTFTSAQDDATVTAELSKENGWDISDVTNEP